MLRVFGPLLTVMCLLVGAVPTAGAEADALAISSNIQALHMPFGTILDPIFEGPESTNIVGYTRCGDSAIWTGHYLAAETFRYVVTHSPDALENARKAVNGIKSLVDVTGTNLLARCVVPVDSPYAPGIISEESHNGAHIGSIGNVPHYWIGNTSRDQYSGAFLGLSIAYDGIQDANLRAEISDLVTRMLEFLDKHNWFVVMPDGAISTTFAGRYDQHLSFLQAGAHVNPGRFRSAYRWYRFWHAPLVSAPIAIELLDVNESYFKFNLDTINLYNLIRLEDNGAFRGWYNDAYKLLRKTTDDHGNAWFNMIDRSLKGPNEHRDAETRALLEEWLQRPRRDFYVDWTAKYPVCGDNRACNPIPVVDRVRTDFLWQRSPFQLFGGGSGRIENPGIDYILPYWMARYYKVLD